MSATFWLLEAPDSLLVQSQREPDGTGIGYFDAEGQPHIDKQPIAASQDKAFAREAHTLRSRTFVAHVRFASTGSLERKNTHPFEQQGRLFAHNGVLGDLPLLESRLGRAAPLVHGDTDSERLFALITAEIDAAGQNVARGIQTAVTWVAEHLPVFSINFVLATDTDVWALRYPSSHGLFVLERSPQAGGELEHRSSLGTHVHSEEGERRELVVLASERLDADPGWRELRSGELVHVDSTLAVHSRVILPSAPSHPLTLDDPEAGAHASQS